MKAIIEAAAARGARAAHADAPKSSPAPTRPARRHLRRPRTRPPPRQGLILRRSGVSVRRISAAVPTPEQPTRSTSGRQWSRSGTIASGSFAASSARRRVSASASSGRGLELGDLGRMERAALVVEAGGRAGAQRRAVAVVDRDEIPLRRHVQLDQRQRHVSPSSPRTASARDGAVLDRVSGLQPVADVVHEPSDDQLVVVRSDLGQSRRALQRVREDRNRITVRPRASRRSRHRTRAERRARRRSPRLLRPG